MHSFSAPDFCLFAESRRSKFVLAKLRYVAIQISRRKVDTDDNHKAVYHDSVKYEERCPELKVPD